MKKFNIIIFCFLLILVNTLNAEDAGSRDKLKKLQQFIWVCSTDSISKIDFDGCVGKVSELGKNFNNLKFMRNEKIITGIHFNNEDNLLYANLKQKSNFDSIEWREIIINLLNDKAVVKYPNGENIFILNKNIELSNMSESEIIRYLSQTNWEDETETIYKFIVPENKLIVYATGKGNINKFSENDVIIKDIKMNEGNILKGKMKKYTNGNPNWEEVQIYQLNEKLLIQDKYGNVYSKLNKKKERDIRKIPERSKISILNEFDWQSKDGSIYTFEDSILKLLKPSVGIGKKDLPEGEVVISKIKENDNIITGKRKDGNSAKTENIVIKFKKDNKRIDIYSQSNDLLMSLSREKDITKKIENIKILNPNPPNNAFDVPTETQLSWECPQAQKNPIAYTILLNENENLKILASNTYKLSYKPSNLKNDTKYFWKVKIVNSNEETISSPTWSFVTKGKAEESFNLIVDSMYPPNNAENINTKVDLSWKIASIQQDSFSYKVFLGKKNKPRLIKKDIKNSFVSLDSLEKNTSYSWYVVAEKNDKSYKLSEKPWYFTTKDLEIDTVDVTSDSISFPKISDEKKKTNDNSKNIQMFPSNNSQVSSNELKLLWYIQSNFDQEYRYDVYFGENPKPKLIAESIQELFFEPENLNSNTTYYWRIVAKNKLGEILIESKIYKVITNE